MKNKNFLPVMLCIIFALTARIFGIIYSVLATNVVYQTGVICQVFDTARQVMSSLAYAPAIGGAMAAFLRKSRPIACFVTYIAVIFADVAVVLTIDLISGYYTDDPAGLILGIFYRVGLGIYSVVLMFAAYLVGKAMVKRGGAIGISAAVAAVLPTAIDFIIVVWKSLAFLIEWEFMPFAGEVYTMVFEISVTVVIGVLSAVIGIALVRRAQNRAKV